MRRPDPAYNAGTALVTGVFVVIVYEIAGFPGMVAAVPTLPFMTYILAKMFTGEPRIPEFSHD